MDGPKEIVIVGREHKTSARADHKVEDEDEGRNANPCAEVEEDDLHQPLEDAVLGYGGVSSNC